MHASALSGLSVPFARFVFRSAVGVSSVQAPAAGQQLPRPGAPRALRVEVSRRARCGGRVPAAQVAQMTTERQDRREEG